MKPPFVKAVVAAGVFVFSVAVLVHHLTMGERIDASRDAQIFRSHPDSSRSIHIRTDFASFYYASKAISQRINIYNAQALDSLARADGVANHVLPYLYPPFFAIVAKPIAGLSPELAQRVWDYAQIAAAGLVCALLCVSLPWRGATTMRPNFLLAGGLI